MTTPQDLALAQASLIHEASLALPDHEQIELFPKRHFRCDCPTSGLVHPCSLRPQLQQLPLNAENTYSQNYFRGGRFCRCAQTYDAKRERETMVQCLSCEDWFHESCLNLRERVPPRELDDELPLNDPPQPTDPASVTQNDTTDADDASSTGSATSLPAALLPGDTYETLICGNCVRKIPTVKRYAGTRGFRMVIPSEDTFKVLGEDWEEVDVVGEEEGKGAGTKRRASASGAEDEQASKRPRADDSNASNDNLPSTSTSAPPATRPNRCTAPPINALAQTILADPTAHGDVFLSAGWRDRWCRCETCSSILKHPFLLEEEETYEPPRDPDAGLSLEELGMRALVTLPHERALDSIRAYNEMRDDLMLYLRPFADSGREVREEDITAFFQRRRQGRV